MATLISPASWVSRGPSSGSIPRCCAASATARYIAPVSRKRYPSRSATSAPIVLFPAPAGPSIATVRGVATLRTSERADLSRRELAPRSRSKPTELERSEPHATKPQHAEADGGAHASHLSLPTGVEHHPDDRPARAAGH